MPPLTIPLQEGLSADNVAIHLEERYGIPQMKDLEE